MIKENVFTYSISNCGETKKAMGAQMRRWRSALQEFRAFFQRKRLLVVG
jgi:hypothetical protein